MQTPLPVQLEHWIKILENKKSPQDLKDHALLHLTNVRDIINKSINGNMRAKNNEGMSTGRHAFRNQK
jgi:hypothetical protein